MSLGLILPLVACAARVAADSGEEFSNNLFSDLAPLLALFGERVTMQFMSQSMGWADNIILAMAPIGIITVIVGAIRVGGPSWLKALIGRARENIAVAEADLMSSTSNEVCELWNGHHVVRCMGSAPILEFICLVPKYGDRKKVQEVRVISLDEALDKHVKKIKKSFPDRFRQIHGLVTEHHNYSKLEQGESNDSSSEIIIVHNQREASPNISLNCHGQICRGELYLVAICATLLQSAVLVYSGFVACQLTAPEDEDVVKGYAFPCTFIGMLLLVSGLLICGHVVESSTEEDRYCPAQGTEARLVWLQQPKTVSDQVFDSYAIFPRHARSIITTSIRKDKAKVANSANSQDERDKPPDKNQRLSMVLETKALIGVIISLCGFIVQFVGLRAMHWSVSVAQLGAILTMAALRALVRRGLAMPPDDKLLDPGFELEWFSLTQIDFDKIWWPCPEADAKKSETSGDWRVMTAGSSDMHSPLWREAKGPRPEHPKPRSKAHQAMIIRKELGQFVTWPAVASIEAAALARAIEITMDALIGPSRADIWSWSLKTHCVDPDGQSEVHFSLRKGDLESLTSELEAALSLWLFSVNQYESDQGLDNRHNRTPGTPSRSKGPLQNSSLRLLGGYGRSLHRDLDWWMPHDATRILRVQEFDWVRNTQNDGIDDAQKVLDMLKHRIVGCGSRESCTSPALAGQARYQSSPLSKLYLDGQREKTETLPRADDSLRTYLAVESSVPLKLLYAQDLFTAFMWSVAKTMPSCIPGGSDLVHNDEGKRGEWISFRFRHEELSRMVQDISNTGLGSLDQIYLSVIPPLSAENKLPETTKIIELARKQARRPQEKQDWIQDSKPYLWLSETAQTFPKDSAVSVRTITALLEYANIMTRALDLREPIHISSESDEKAEAEEPLVKAKMMIEDKIKEWLGPGEDVKTRAIFSYLRALYEEQGREWRWETAQEPKATPESVTEYPQVFGFGELHRLYQKSSRLISRGIRASLNRGQGVDQQDVFNWTPLHYAAAKGNASAAGRLLEYEADVNARDLVDWTPLHYACHRGNTAVVDELLLAQADVNLRGIDGVTPLHCAAMSGCIDAAKSLIKARATADATDNAGNTWLHWAAFHSHAKFMVELKPEVDINLRNHNGRSPLHLASSNGHDAIVKTLVGNGADIGAEDDANQTPLHFAAANGHEDVVEVLVERGARIDVRNGRGEMPLHLAANRGYRAVAEYLESCSRQSRLPKPLVGGTGTNADEKGTCEYHQ
ncbi:hypothetical protein NM208_g7414 [Fusarium decemcellulare]|uniref:Uncharacterized protein n=1 Tax=Fusarium decemcellulare TaxID=57161 RepID=A0ACC1S9F1_9HYPO|nr:hypothetical protein NM208_g7414 [Fusarium decemcellulare]